MTPPPPTNPDLIDLRIADPRWEATNLAALAPQAAAAALRSANLPEKDVEIALLATNNAEIAQLNADFRAKPTPTNVLAWPAFDLAPTEPGSRPIALDLKAQIEQPVALGDIAIAYETVAAEAHTGAIPLDHHIFHLILHATLHLLGYDHVRAEDAALMETLEIQALATAGIASPYE